ncbi:VOC family protein [Micromonospora matsumotoense]|uniref:VOC family protein n=1 Tax=Micromonospora matsumotoense TaxID=121616 RepID=UPI003428D1D8
MIGRLEKTVLDCSDPWAPAACYVAVLGMRINEDSDDWAVIGTGPGQRQLVFPRIAHWRAPDRPESRHPPQVHLNIRVDDVDTAEHQIIVLGGSRPPGEVEGRYRVFADPAGHPFCPMCGRHSG